MNNLIPQTLQVPAHIAERLKTPSTLAQAVAAGLGGGAAYPRISIKGSRFRIIEDGAESVLDTLSLDVIIVGANPGLAKTYYEKQWSPDQEATAPDCQSFDGVAPSADSPQKQSDLCATCPQNVWGSKINPQTGGQIKACSDSKRLAVVAADDPGGKVYLLTVTPAALKGLGAYQKVLAMRGLSPEYVRTQVSFDTSVSFPKIQFAFGGFVDEEAVVALEKVLGSSEVREITGESAPKAVPPPAAVGAAKPATVKVAKAAPVAPAAPAAPAAPVATAPKGFGAKAAPAAPAAPAQDAPAIRRGFGAPKAPAAKPAAATAAVTVAAGGDLEAEINDILKNVDADDA